MLASFKWFVILLLAGLAWLVGVITTEYLRPYQKVRIRLK